MDAKTLTSLWDRSVKQQETNRQLIEDCRVEQTCKAYESDLPCERAERLMGKP